MKNNDLKKILPSVESLFRWAGDEKLADEIKQLLEVSVETKNIDLTLPARFLVRETGSHVPSRYMIHDLLKKVSELQRSSGAAAMAKKVSGLADAINDAKTQHVAISEFANALQGHDPVTLIVDRLNAVAGNRSEFDQIIAAISKKGAMTKTQICKIAHLYTSGPKTYKTNAAAITDIKDKFTSDMLFNSKIA